MSPSRRTGNKRVLWRAIEVSHPVSGRGATTGGARALDTKPRTVVASRHGQRRGGAMGTSRPTATGPCSETAPWGTGGAHGNGAGCQAAHRAIGAAARWGHRALPQRGTSVEHGDGHGDGRGDGFGTGAGAARGMQWETCGDEVHQKRAGIGVGFWVSCGSRDVLIGFLDTISVFLPCLKI